MRVIHGCICCRNVCAKNLSHLRWKIIKMTANKIQIEMVQFKFHLFWTHEKIRIKHIAEYWNIRWTVFCHVTIGKYTRAIVIIRGFQFKNVQFKYCKTYVQVYYFYSQCLSQTNLLHPTPDTRCDDWQRENLRTLVSRPVYVFHCLGSQGQIPGPIFAINEYYCPVTKVIKPLRFFSCQ